MKTNNHFRQMESSTHNKPLTILLVFFFQSHFKYVLFTLFYCKSFMWSIRKQEIYHIFIKNCACFIQNVLCHLHLYCCYLPNWYSILKLIHGKNSPHLINWFLFSHTIFYVCVNFICLYTIYEFCKHIHIKKNSQRHNWQNL